MLEKRTVDISTGIIFRTVIILLGIWFLYIIRDIVAILFIAVIFAASIEPAVDWMERKKIPRSIGVLAVYLLVFSLVGIFIYFLIPPLVNQFNNFIQDFPFYAEKINQAFSGLESYAQSHNFSLGSENLLETIGGNISQTSTKIFTTTIGVFSGFISIIVVLSLTFYMSMKKDGIQCLVHCLVPCQHQEYASDLVNRMKIKIGKWMQGQILLMFIVFICYFIVLYFLKVPYALVLAIFGGVLEIIPYLGPIISAIPAIILGFFVSPLTGLLVLVFYILIQQLENHVMVPQIMKKAVGLNPIVVILVLLIGAKIGGTMGAILSIPVATVINVFLQDVFFKKKK
jgi:predicted PurR-regulated permease PerM